MKVIGYSPISSDERWRASNLKLGDAVFAVIHHFQLTPPSILEITDANLKRLQDTLSGPRPPSNNSTPNASASPKRRNGSTHDERPQRQNQPQQNEIIVEEKPNFDVSDYEIDALIPPVPSSFLKVDQMPLSELHQLVESKSFLTTFVNDTDEVKTLKAIKQSIETSNIKAAKANLVHEGEMEGLCTEVESLKEVLNLQMQQYRKLDGERVSMTHPPDLQEAIRELQKAKKDAFRESENLADEWIEGGGDNVSDFVKEFMEVRLLYHTRAAKAERLENSM